MARKRRTTTRRRRRSPSRRGLAGVINADLLSTVGASTVGFVASNMIVDRLPGEMFKTGYGRIAGKAGVALAGGIAIRKFANAKAGNAFMVGGLVAVALDIANNMNLPTGQKGLGAFGEPGGIPLFANELGLGDYGDVDDSSLVMVDYAA